MSGRLATIGVYGFTVDEFLTALRSADVRVLLDVRQRRGVRGPEHGCYLIAPPPAAAGPRAAEASTAAAKATRENDRPAEAAVAAPRHKAAASSATAHSAHEEDDEEKELSVHTGEMERSSRKDEMGCG